MTRRKQSPLKSLLGLDPQSFEAPERGVGTPLESYTDSRPRVPFRLVEEGLESWNPHDYAQAEAAPAVEAAAPVEPTPGVDTPAPVSAKPRMSAQEVADMLAGRKKFSDTTGVEPAPGMRDELDRSGVEYGRTQRELKRLLGMPDADPAEVGRMKQGARELGSRLRKTAKSAVEPPPTPEEPPVMNSRGDGPQPPPPGREGHFKLPKPSVILPERMQDEMLAGTDARMERRGIDLGRAEGERRQLSPDQAARINREMDAVAAAPPAGGDSIPQAIDSPQFQAEFGPTPDWLNNEKGFVDFSELATPESRKRIGAAAQAHQAGSLLFNPLTLARIGVSNTSSALLKSLEHSAKERSLAPTGRIIKELLNPQMITDAVDAFKNPHDQPTRDGSPAPGGGMFGLASRAIGSVDAPFRGAMERAGFPSEDALTVTQQRRPLTDTGKATVDWQQRNAITRLLVPFIKSKVNEFETGITEPLQSAGRMATGSGDAGDAVKVGAAAGAGALGYSQSDKLDELPAPLRALVMALGGLYSAPAAIGYGAGHLGEGMTGAYNALIKALPLAEGFSLDPRTQVNRIMPRILNPDYWTGTKRSTPSFLDKIKSQIPGLAQTLPEARPQRAHPAKAAHRAPK
jgi:hypothetical protein